MSVKWYLLAGLGLTALCAGDTPTAPDQLLSMVTWAVQSVTEPLLGQQARQQARLDGLSGQLDSLSRLVSELAGRQTQLDVTTSQQSGADSQRPLLDQLSSRLDQLERQRSSPAAVPGPQFAGCSQSAPQSSLPRDCSDLPAGSKSGIYVLQPGLDRALPPVPSFCDLDTDGGGWTVFQRRADIKPRQDFFLGWAAYSDGFGELDMEFWWGLEHLFTTTAPRDRRYELRIDLEDIEGAKRHAVYQGFRISSKDDGYRLQAANYSGDAGDSLSQHFGMKFSTKDKDQDKYHVHCARTRKGAWWYNRCFDSNLNGIYFEGDFRRGLHGVTWKTWRGGYHSLKTVEMKFRPTIKSG